MICELNWEQKERIKKISSTFHGNNIWADGREMKEDEEVRVPAVIQRFNEILDRIYGGDLPEQVVCGSMSHRWFQVAQIILFGKQNGLIREDWGRALRERGLSR